MKGQGFDLERDQVAAFTRLVPGGAGVIRGEGQPCEKQRKKIMSYLLEGGVPERRVTSAIESIEGALQATVFASKAAGETTGFKKRIARLHKTLRAASVETDKALAEGTIDWLTAAYWHADLLPKLDAEERQRRQQHVDEDLRAGDIFNGPEVAEAMQRKMYRLLDLLQMIERGIKNVELRGRSADPALHNLSEGLAELWHHYTGREPTAGTDPKSGEASGPYGRFAHCVIACLPYGMQPDGDTRRLILDGLEAWRARRTAGTASE